MAYSALDSFEVRSYVLSDMEFDRVSRMVQQTCGIHLKDGKQDLVRARLSRRLRTLRLASFSDYFDFVEADETRQELAELLDLITTNKTQFFRDAEQFTFLARHVYPSLAKSRMKARIWSAGCSSGQEPYSLAIDLNNAMPGLSSRDVKILATDICRPALELASEGKYGLSDLDGLADDDLSRHFNKVDKETFQVKRDLRKMVFFAWLNLQSDWPMKGPFQVIFCRNVMIYFDRPTREQLINRFWELLAPGGIFCVGLSEGLTGLHHRYRYVQPAVYVKE
jgi:chemotaxis protein methyltransferase CheR